MTDKPPRFTKRRGKPRRSEIAYRLTDDEQQAFRRIIYAGDRPNQDRLRLLASSLAENLHGDERIDSTNAYEWIRNRLRGTKPMLLKDAARIYVAGMRISIAAGFDSPVDWQASISKIPAIPTFHLGYGIQGRFRGIYDGPFQPVFVPRAYVPKLTEDLARVAIERDDGAARRTRVGENIERWLNDQFEMRPGHVGWNASMSFAIEQLVTQVLFREHFRGRLGPVDADGYSQVNEVAVAVAHVIHDFIHSSKPDAFEVVSSRLTQEIEAAQARRVAATPE